jgi:hypothetical protein
VTDVRFEGKGLFSSSAAAGIAVATSLPASIRQRIAEPDEIATTAGFIHTDEASVFTGAVRVPDGGATSV